MNPDIHNKKAVRVNYKEFLDRFETSGLNQRAFAEREGISSSMVSYYIRKARSTSQSGIGFAQIKVIPPKLALPSLKIKYPSGVELEIYL